MNTKIIDGKKYVELDIVDIYIDGNKIDKEFKLESSSVDLLVKLVEPVNSASEDFLENNNVNSLNTKDLTTEDEFINNNINSQENKHSKKHVYGLFIIAVTIIIIQTVVIFLK
ncbi:hypothetical protein [Romboutsia sp.]|uniref:hypothetical protein n=1 Tax=Romboutsia sp. TaxID=1965302 RepID=UPI003F354A9F